MTKSILVFLLTVGLVGGGVWWWYYGKTETPIGTSNNEASVQETQVGRYQEYSPEKFEAFRSQKRVLYFHADWCPICRPLDKKFREQHEQIPEDVIVFKVDYDTETSLKQKYSVTSQHTFVYVDMLGEVIEIWSGGDIADLIANTQ